MTSEQLVLDELFAQRVAVQARPFGHTHQHVVHAIGRLAAQVAKVALQALAHAFFYVFLAHAANPSCSSGSASKPVTAGPRTICAPGASGWWAPACHCVVQSSIVLMCCLKASPPGSARRYQAMCLRALRTPVSSPYRLRSEEHTSELQSH